MTEQTPKQPEKSKRLGLGRLLKGVGAAGVSTLALFAGTAHAKSEQASATKNTPGHIKQGREQDLPTGITLKDTTFDQTGATLMDGLEAYQAPKVQWNGMLVLRTPSKKWAEVGFAPSPKSYFPRVGLDVDGFDPNSATDGTDGVFLIYNPSIFKYKVGNQERLFAMVRVYGDNQPLFIDLDFANEVGALSMYEQQGQKPGTSPIVETSQHSLILELDADESPTGKPFHSFIDPNTNKIVTYVPSNVFPHL